MKIGTRGSDLALWQARFVRALLQEEAGVEADLVIIKTAGDLDHSVSLAAMAGKGFFTKEIEEALLAKRVDVAVHSLKDLQTQMPDGLELCAMPQRADRRDVLLIRHEAVDAGARLRLKTGARVGTSANRRISQLQYLRPDLKIEMLRGNVPTRVRKLRDGEYDAIVAAAAGLDRLELPLDDFEVYRLPESLFVPAPGQGVLGLQIRENDDTTGALIGRLDNPDLRKTVYLERDILRRLEGGCQLALGTAAEATTHGMRLIAFLGTDDPSTPRRITIGGVETEPILDAAESFLRVHALPVPKTAPVRVWITREPERAQAFCERFDAAEYGVSSIPTFFGVTAGSHDEQHAALDRLGSYDWVFLTSQVAVAIFSRLMKKYGANLSAKTRIAAVGRKTAGAIAREGWRVDFVSDVADALSLGESFLAASGERIGRVLFPCAAAASDTLETTLADSCESFDRMVCYDTVEHPQLAQAVTALPDPQVIVFTSPQAARYLVRRRTVDVSTPVVSIGPATTDALLAAGFPVVYEAPDRSLESTAEVIHGLFATQAATAAAPQSAHP